MATKRKLTDEQIVGVVKQLEAGRTVAREIGVSTYTDSTMINKVNGIVYSASSNAMAHTVMYSLFTRPFVDLLDNGTSQ